MLTAKRDTNSRRRRMNRDNDKVKVWAEEKPRGGGWIIYAGIPGTDSKTVAGAAASRSTLDYNLGRARRKFLGGEN